ncbi:MAG: SGNH/GDSL hydrolase family protein [Lachnospiraceae bacterium]|nr:SGNH/GDSL hydrolase family protein [Lachnospiraceae bacterium]
MKNLYWKKGICLLTITALLLITTGGCSRKAGENEIGENASADNIIITETGEVIEREDSFIEISPLPETALQQEKQRPEVSQEIITVDPEQLVEPEQIDNMAEQSGQQVEPYDDGRLQIVFMGDSIFASNNGDGTSIPERTAALCDANFYNLAIAGRTAAVLKDEQFSWEEWESTGLLGIVYAVTGNIPTDIFEGHNVKAILDNPDVDFSKTDYFVIEYGTNDFLSGVPLDSESRDDHARTYVGALRDAVSALKRFSPDATIVLCSPMYAQFFDGSWMIGDGNVTNNGYGTLFDYKGKCEYVANEQQTLFFNAYQDLNITGYTAEEYLEDGVHLTDSGRQLYSDTLSRIILNYEETKNN